MNIYQCWMNTHLLSFHLHHPECPPALLLIFSQWICHRSIRAPRQSDSTQGNLVIVALWWWSTLTLSFTKCIRLLSCCGLFAMVTTALRDLKEMNMGGGNHSGTLKRTCVFGIHRCCRLAFGCTNDAAGVKRMPRQVGITEFLLSHAETRKIKDTNTSISTIAFSFSLPPYTLLIFLESTTYITDSGLHYLQARLLLQLLLLLDCTGDKSRGGVEYEQWMTK